MFFLMWKEEVSKRVFVASTMQRTRVSRLERCYITATCERNRLAASVCCINDATHRDFEAGDVSGEVLHHGGMWKEDVSERVFVASRWNAEGRG